MFQYNQNIDKSLTILIIVLITGALNFATITEKQLIEEKFLTKDNILVFTYLLIYLFLIKYFLDLDFLCLLATFSMDLLYFKFVKNNFYLYLFVINLFPQLIILLRRDEIWWLLLIKIYIGVVLQETIFTKIHQKLNIKFSIHYTHMILLIFVSALIVEKHLLQNEKIIFDFNIFQRQKNFMQILLHFLYYKLIIIIGILEYNIFITLLTNMKIQYSIYALDITALFLIELSFNIFAFLFYLGLFWMGFFFINQNPHRRDLLLIENTKLRKEINTYYKKYFQKDLFHLTEVGVIDERPKLRLPLL